MDSSGVTLSHNHQSKPRKKGQRILFFLPFIELSGIEHISVFKIKNEFILFIFKARENLYCCDCLRWEHYTKPFNHYEWQSRHDKGNCLMWVWRLASTLQTPRTYGTLRGFKGLFSVFIFLFFPISLSENTSPAVILRDCTVMLSCYNLIQKLMLLNCLRRNSWQFFNLMPCSLLGPVVPWPLKLIISVCLTTYESLEWIKESTPV